MVITIIYSSLGYFVTFKILQYKVKKEVKRQIKFSIPENQLVSLYIPKSVEFGNDGSFVRMHKGEFRYKGQMYDIIRYEDLGDVTHYTCFHDVKESGLFDSLDKMVRENLPSNPKQHSNQKLISLVLLLFYERQNVDLFLFDKSINIINFDKQISENLFVKYIFHPPCC